MRRIEIMMGLLALLLAFASCGDQRPKSTSTRGIAKIMCDESFQSVLEQEIAVFEYQYPEASIMPEYINEHAAFDSLMHNKVDLIITSRYLTKEQRDSLSYGNKLYITFPAKVMHLFDPATEKSLIDG